jgi:hypothetical protein
MPDVCEADLDQFPDEATLERQVAFGRQHVEWLTLAAGVKRGGGEYKEWLADAEERVALWELAWWARTDIKSGSESQALLKLECLRDKLGPQDYYRGMLPDVVPTWRFRKF